jgi:hypothetical protein
MTSMPAAVSFQRPTALAAIGRAGLLAGSLDILAAFTVAGMRGFTPARLLKGVAAGLLGRTAALNGGLGVALLGLLCHFTVAFGAATVYYLASRKLHVLVRHPWICGPLYGIAVYCFMNLVVIPLSAITNPAPAFTLAPLLRGIPVHMFCVGLPMALMIAKFAPAERAVH